MPPAPPTRPTFLPKRQARFTKGTLFYALLLQAALLLAAVFIVVIRPLMRSEPEFSGGATLQLPQRELEHRAALAELGEAGGGPPPLEKLSTQALLPPELPSLPAAPQVQMRMEDASDPLYRDAQALLAQSGLADALQGIKGAASAAAFFGVEAEGERIVIVVNTSVSVRNKAQRRNVPWSRIQQEVLAVVDQLDSGTLFALVQFSQGVRVFPEALAPATATNREAMRAWVREELRGNPPVDPGAESFGHEAALEAAFALDPDVLFLVTDGVLDRREVKSGRVVYPKIPYDQLLASVREARRGLSRRLLLHVVGFEVKVADEAGLRRLAAEFGGQVRTF